MRSKGCLARPKLDSFVLLAFFAVVVGCSGPEPRDTLTVVPTDADTEIRNLRSSTEVLKTALGAMARERDHYKDQFLSADQEVRTRLASVEYLEARHRAHLQMLNEAKTLSAQASAAADTLQSQLDEQTQRYAGYDQTLVDLRNQLREKTDTVTTVSQALARAENDVKRFEAENGRLQERLSGDSKRGDERLERKEEELAASKLQVQELKRELIDVKRERDAAVASGGGEVVAAVGPTVVTQTPAQLSATAFLVDWWNRSVAEVRAGRFNDDNRLLLAFVGAGVIFLTLTFFFMARAAGARSRVRDLIQQLDGAIQQNVATPLRADEVSPAVAQVSAEAEQLAATMQMDAPSPSFGDGGGAAAAAPPFEEELDKTQMLGSASAISKELDDVLGDVAREEPTMMIPDPSDAAVVADEGDAETVHDDALLSDLKSAIQEKFAELRDK